MGQSWALWVLIRASSSIQRMLRGTSGQSRERGKERSHQTSRKSKPKVDRRCEVRPGGGGGSHGSKQV